MQTINLYFPELLLDELYTVRKIQVEVLSLGKTRLNELILNKIDSDISTKLKIRGIK